AELHIPAWPFEPLYYAIVHLRAGFDPRTIDVEAAARRVRVPVLLLHGDADTDIPLSHSERIAAALPAPHELVTIPVAHHHGPRSKDVLERIRQFLQTSLARERAIL